MANSTSVNPIFCDTAGTLKPSMPINLKAIAWLNDESAGKDIAAADDMLLSDINGTRIIGKRAIAGGDGLEWFFPENFVVDGLVMTALDGGVCYIFI